MSASQLRSNIDRLIHEHTVSVDGTYRKAPSLLSVLRQMKITGSRATGNGSSSGAHVPVALNAFDLLESIAKNLSARYAAIHGVDDKRMLVESKLIVVRNSILGGADELEIARLESDTRKWIAAITEMSSPVAKAPLHGTCPIDYCATATIPTSREGGTYHEAAMWFYGTAIYCHACGNSWEGIARIEELKASMDALVAA